MLEYVGDRFDYISSRGEAVALVLTAAAWLGYVLTETRRSSDDSVQRILWFSFWMAEFTKAVRSATFALLGNGMIGLLGLVMFLRSVRRKRSASDPLLTYLMACVLLYTAGSLASYHSARNVRLFLTIALLWWAILLCSRNQDPLRFFRHVFSGFGWLLAYTVILVLAFTLLLPADTSSEMSLAGPYRQNELARTLFVLLVGLFCRCYVVGDFRPQLFHLCWPVTLLMSSLTLSRSGMALSYVFLAGNLGSLTRTQRRFMLVVACATIGILLFRSDFFMDKLRRRFAETGDGGRVEGIKLIVEEGKRELAFGHGFMKSSIETFQDSRNIYRDSGYASHCFIVSVFYEFGVVGSLIYSALYFAVLLRLFLAARRCLSYRFAFVAFMCFCISGVFENSAWWPITPLGLLASVLIVTAPRLARQADVSPFVPCLSHDHRWMELADAAGGLGSRRRGLTSL